MMHLRPKLTYANVVATAALFMALGGGAYAAATLPAKSVGTRQLQAAAVTGPKIKNGTITGAKINAGTLGVVPTAESAQRADSAALADHAVSADKATSAEKAGEATNAANAELLGGSPASGFVSSSQVGYIDRSLSGCTNLSPCSEDVLTIGTVTFRAICENAAGIAGVVIRVVGASRSGYSFVSETNNARHGAFEGEGNVVVATTTGTSVVGGTGTIVARTPSRIVSLQFNATTRAPTISTAECTVAATALAA